MYIYIYIYIRINITHCRRYVLIFWIKNFVILFWVLVQNSLFIKKQKIKIMRNLYDAQTRDKVKILYSKNHTNWSSSFIFIKKIIFKRLMGIRRHYNINLVNMNYYWVISLHFLIFFFKMADEIVTLLILIKFDFFLFKNKTTWSIYMIFLTKEGLDPVIHSRLSVRIFSITTPWNFLKNLHKH